MTTLCLALNVYKGRYYFFIAKKSSYICRHKGIYFLYKSPFTYSNSLNMKTRYLKINPLDNVAVAITCLKAGETIQGDEGELIVKEEIPAGHKVTLKEFSQGENVIKYGYPIGHTIEPMEAGCWISDKQIKTNLEGLLEYTYHPVNVPLDIPFENRYFKGYRRKNGDVGIRNEIWIIPTVGCVNGITNQLAENLRKETDGQGVDVIKAFPHNYGCSQLGDDHENTKKILRDMVKHPNAGGVLVLGLGCENNNIAEFKNVLGEWNENMVKNAIIHELDREGQVFYLYNRVETIQEFKNQLQKIVPNARIAIGHGQMDEKTLEEVIVDFSNQEYDILLATTIIENGINSIPRIEIQRYYKQYDAIACQILFAIHLLHSPPLQIKVVQYSYLPSQSPLHLYSPFLYI